MKVEQIDQVNFEKKINYIFEKESFIVSKKTKALINEVLENSIKVKFIINIIVDRIYLKQNNPNILDGFIYQKIVNEGNNESKKELIQYFPNGLMSIKTNTNINYKVLENLLVNQTFQEADKITQEYLCKLVSNQTKQEKKWLYFTDIQFLSQKDLYTIDLLWRIYSQGKFGFSVQKKLWIKSETKWDDLWEKIKWTNNGVITRYPTEFIWTIDAPEGHLPLFNQLRGTQTLACLFKKIEW
uniref:GUN4-like domain-containing protein n=1 Tax=Polysiphonia scopulorum TaxID=257860 RepID=A0A1Z1MID7_9FLOR|nr:hypothetical protein [Polysiphonia scopulorum]ARW65504.1 hypothetical protein [Polysiphonia scopulorum]